MTNQDDPKSERDDSDDDERSSSPPEEAAPRKREASKGGGTKKRSAARAASGPSKASGGGMQTVALAGAVALAVGAAGGWFGHEAQAKAKLHAESTAAPAGSATSGPCNAWEKKICSSTGEQSAACAEAKGALDLLTTATCEVALEAMPATLAKVKASRASCDTLISRLCKDLPPGSAACTMVKERTPSFPAARCDEMLTHYDEVIQGLRQLDQEQGLQMGVAPPGAMPPGAVPPGAVPPGALPPGAVPLPRDAVPPSNP